MKKTGFYKRAQASVLATYNSVDSTWKKTASRGISHFAQANARSVSTILEAVADKYCISKDPADYIFVVYRAVTQDVPNGNGDAFPREELLSWNKFEKKPVYRTFEFKPKHVNHQADDPRLARGVVVDCHFNEEDPADCFVELLIAVDTKKDPILAKGIMDGILLTVSMGCDALRTECNVCDNVAYSDKDYCKHIKPGNRMKEHVAANGEKKLAYERCYDVTFQEISNVDDPADKKADLQEALTVHQMPHHGTASNEIASAKIATQSGMLDLKARVRRLENFTAHDGLKLAASLTTGDLDMSKVAAKKTKELPEHHKVSAIYAKHHELHYGDHAKAMQACMHETGKSEQEIKACWGQKMAEEMPHPQAHEICASLNAQLKACGDMKKAVKRAAEDMQVDHDMVAKCAEHAKSCNRMAGYTPYAKQEGTDMAKAAQAVEINVSESAPGTPSVEINVPEGGAAAPHVEPHAEPESMEAKLASAATASADALKKAQLAQPAETPADKPPGAIEQVQAEDGPDKKSLGDMGVKAVGGKEAQSDTNMGQGAGQEHPAPLSPAVQAQPPVENQQPEPNMGEASGKEAIPEPTVHAAKTASFPFTDFYKDTTAKKVASGAVHVMRSGKLVFTVPPSQKTDANSTLKLIASVGMVGAMKKLSAIHKKADAGVAEAAVTDIKGGRPPSPQSIEEAAISDGKDKRHPAPASSTAQGNTTDMKQKVDTKSISNSDVRDSATSNNKGGYETSADTMVKDEHNDNKEKHPSKDVGSDNILTGRQVDMVLAGIDPKTATLLRSRLASFVASAPTVDPKVAAAHEAKEKEEKAKKDKHEKEAAALELVAKLDKFKRGLKLAARRFALNLEPCDLKHSLGAVLSTRHEASGFEGMEADLVMDIVERGFSMGAALEKTVDHMIKRAQEMSAMPDDSLAAIEADAAHLEPVHPASGHEHHEEEHEHEGRTASLRRRAMQGSMPTLRSAEGSQATAIPSKLDLVKQAVGGSNFGSRFYRR